MSGRELMEWAAFERLEGPVGPARGDMQAALVASVIANANRGKGKRAFKVEDFMPRWDEGTDAPDERTPEQQRAAFAGLVGKPVERRELLGPDGQPIEK